MSVTLDSMTVAHLFLLIIYLNVLVIYDQARREYGGGQVGNMINMVLMAVVLLFAADYMSFFLKGVSDNILFIGGNLLRLMALCVLGFAGVSLLRASI